MTNIIKGAHSLKSIGDLDITGKIEEFTDGRLMTAGRHSASGPTAARPAPAAKAAPTPAPKPPR